MTTVTTPPSLERFIGQRVVLLTTYKRDGTPKGTPVSIAVEGDHAFVRTGHNTWKVKRLRRNPDTLVAPSTFRGKPTGDAVKMRARLLSGEENDRASRLISRKYRILEGIIVPIAFRLARIRALHYELAPLDL